MYIFSRSRQPGFVLRRFDRELPAPDRIQFPIGDGHSPIGNAAVRVEASCLAKGTLGLDEPKSVQLADPLFDVPLHQWIARRHGKMDVARPAHEVGPLARTAVERLAVMRMTGEHAIVGPRGGRSSQESCDEPQRNDGCTH